MVRTKSDRVPAKVSGGKSATKTGKSTPMRIIIGGGGSKGKPNSGGNRAHPRDTPQWQKPITGFFNQSSTEEDIASGASTSQAGNNLSAEQAGNDSE